ncbi:MAG: cytidylyltransferase domain-containing protein, partial [Alphaproteobacteria bacterium]
MLHACGRRARARNDRGGGEGGAHRRLGFAVKRICIVCARGGSKGVPSKNIRLFAGRPLLAHTLGQAIETRLFD